MRIPFFTATIIPVVLGSIIAWRDIGTFHWVNFCLTLVGALWIHAGTNMANDYFDHIVSCDELNQYPTPFSGGSRVIQEKMMSPRGELLFSLICFSLGGSIGLYLNYVSGGYVILVLGVVGVFLGFFHCSKFFKIYYGGFGELAVGIGFGPLMVLGSYYVQAQHISTKAFLISIPVGILIACVLFINEFPDHSADQAVGKKTLVVIFGKGKAIVYYHLLLGLSYLMTGILIAFKFLPLSSLIVFLSLPLAFKAFWVS